MKSVVQKVPFLQGANDVMISMLVCSLNLRICTPAEVLIKEGSFGSEMFFVDVGELEISFDNLDEIGGAKDADGGGEDRSNARRSKKKDRIQLGEGSFVGEISMLIPSLPRTCNVVCKTHCELYRLSKGDWDSVLHAFPDFERVVQKIASARLTRFCGTASKHLVEVSGPHLYTVVCIVPIE
jgi:CRP-like cAMP-binding protein